MSNTDFHGRVALVTGGSRGIGRAIALQLAREGANVAISYASRPEPAKKTQGEIELLGRKSLAVACNVASQGDVDALVSKTRETLGPIDLLVHCGAISNTCNHDELTWELWNEMIDVNLHGAFRVLYAVKDEMVRRKFGRIVMLSSVAALRPRARQIHYSASKAGVIAMTRCLAEGLAPNNVRINAIAPGLIDTEMAKVLTPQQTQTVIDQTPMGRLGTPEDIAEVACFLLSERSKFVVGQTVSVCGGRIMIP
ncbi:MAG: 3-oxoacyl-ACP reductase FabG [Planctomycetia bacterium]|nr:3-oxoacyl-ACP reductase FabG [Planctomycetia bacterium]